MSQPRDEAAFLELTRKISRETGIPVDAYKDKCLRRRIAVRMRASGAHTYSEYQVVLDRDPAEYERLKDTITINVTSFYRNAETWNLVAGLLPDVCSASSAEVRAWSAGCASGEEPYTLAMLIADFAEAQGRSDQLDRIAIDATDVDRQSLERAKAARYRSDALADIPSHWRQRYFQEDSDEYQVVDRVRRRVVVRFSDLCTDSPPRRHYQLILCRNVVIYFGRAAQERVFSTFAESLAPGGYLVLGKVESLLGPARDQLTLLDPRERIYRRAA